MLQAIRVGVWIPLGYDGLRILRRVIPHKRLAVSLEDLLFWMVCAVGVFLWLYRVSNGGLRWFAVAGALAGMLFYKRLFSNLLVTCVSRVVRFFLGILRKILKKLTTPLRYLVRNVHLLQNKTRNHRRKVLGNVKLWLKIKWKAFKIRVTRR